MLDTHHQLAQLRALSRAQRDLPQPRVWLGLVLGVQAVVRGGSGCLSLASFLGEAHRGQAQPAGPAPKGPAAHCALKGSLVPFFSAHPREGPPSSCRGPTDSHRQLPPRWAGVQPDL